MIPLIPESDSQIPLNYLTSKALPELQKHVDISNEDGLDVLVRSLLFENYDDFIYNLYQENFERYVPEGYFFSEFILTKELGLDFKQSFRLKSKLDNFHFYDSGISSGNIEFADLKIINQYSFKIIDESVSRIMFDYPISFYCRDLTQSFHFEEGFELRDYNCLWCDDFSFYYPKYFGGIDHQVHYVETILKSLLLADDLIIGQQVLDSWEERNYPLYESILAKFENYPVYSNYPNSNTKYGNLFPLIGDSLTTRIKKKSGGISLGSSKTKWTIGNKIRHYEKKLNINQKSLAEKSNIRSRTIRDLEKDKRDPDLYTIRRICDAFSISLSEFFQDIE